MTKFRTKISVLFILILLSLSLVGTASWMIVLSSSRDVDSAEEYSNPCFTSTGVYNGDVQIPTLNDLGAEVYGEDFISSADCTVEYVRGEDANGKAFSDYSDNASVATGTHYYKIIDNKTGQVICEEHAYRITPSPLIVKEVALVSGSKNTFFVGDTIELLLTVKVPKGADNHDKKISVSYSISEADYTPSATIAHAPQIEVDVTDLAIEAGFSSNANIDVSLPVKCNLDGLAVVLPTTYVTTNANTAPTYYGTLNAALDATSTANATGTTVVAMQSFNYGESIYSATTLTAVNHYSHKITRNVTINTNVTLVLPFDIDGETTNRHLVKDENGNAPANYLPTYAPRSTNLVSFDVGNITLTLNGTLLVGGLTGGKSGTPQGITSNKYATLQMRSDSKINVTASGNIECLGYITDPDYNVATGVGAQITATSGATIKMPFVVHDYHGGSHTVGAYHRRDGDLSDAIAPFNVFDLPNVQAKLTCASGAVIKGYGDLYASDTHNYTEIMMLGGAGANAFLILENGNATFKYTPTQGADFGKNVSDTNYNNSKPTYDAVTRIQLNGNAKTGSLSMDVKVKVKLSDYLSGTLLSLAQRILANGKDVVDIAKTVNLSDIRIPISHKFQIELNGNNNYEITSDYKFLPGSSLTVNSGATLKVGSAASAIFYSNNIYTAPALTNSSQIATSVAWLWQKDTTGCKDPYRPAATLIVNGTLVVDGGSIAGLIRAESVGATLDLTRATALSLSSTEGNGSYSIDVDLSTIGALGGDFGKAIEGNVTKIYIESSSASGILGVSGEAGVNAQFGKARYTSASYGNGVYGWKQYTVSYEWVYDGTKHSTSTFIPNITNGNPFAYSTAVPLEFVAPSISTGEPYFEGWYADPACTVPIYNTSGKSGNLTVYGKWVDEITYNVDYVTNINFGTVPLNIVSGKVPDGNFNPYINTTSLAAMNASKYDATSSHYIVEWYTGYDESTGTYSGLVSSTSGMNITADTTLYAKWEAKSVVNIAKSGSPTISAISATTDGEEVNNITATSTKIYLVSGSKITVSASYTVTDRAGLGSKTIKARVTISGTGQDSVEGYKESKGSFFASLTATATATASNWVIGEGTTNITVTATNS